MWVLDTNVVSEMVAARPSARVVAWFATAPREDLFTTAITETEIFFGIERLPAGRRRESLRATLEAVFDTDFRGQVLPFDGRAARVCAILLARRESEGRPLALADAQIAAIAGKEGATLVTRNTRDFAACGLTLFNPWLDQ